MAKKQLTAVGYARISKDDALEGRGVGRQTEDVTEVCDSNGWHLSEVLVDNDISASRYSKKPRPGFERLLELIDAGTVDRAVVYNLDRLLRQPRQLEDLIDLCDRKKGKFELHTVTGEVDLRTASGRFSARALVAVAAMESDNMSRRLQRAFADKARKGQPHGARAFGYEPDGLTVRESEAVLYRAAAADVLAGVSLNTIARRWNDLGVTTPQRQRPWSGTVVKAVLTNPRHAGLRTYHGEIVGQAAWPSIIDRDVHDRLVAVLTGPGRRRTPPSRTAFTGLITGPNGVPLDRDTVRGRPFYRGHRRPGREADQVSISAEPLERLIVAAVFETVDAGELAAAADDLHRRAQSPPDVSAIEDDLRALAEDFGRGRISRTEWLAARDQLEDRLTAARRAVPASAAPPLAGLRDRWDDLDVDQQRAVLCTLIERVVVAPAAKRGGPQPMVEGIGRIDTSRVSIEWRD